ncbi:MAG: hypothetical protein IKG59_07235, partial [Firmicutes bacterium]|nr:hypothetical protein [Bacillota bacterium]
MAEVKHTLSVDIESYSSVDLSEAGVYRYTEAPDFEVLLIGYSLDGGPVEVVDFTIGRLSSGEIFDLMTFIEWLQDPGITKTAWNANFERTCLAAALGMEMPPEQWSDTMT